MTAAPRDERLLRAIQYAASALDTDQPLRLTLHASDQSKIIRCNRSSLYRFGVGCLPSPTTQWRAVDAASAAAGGSKSIV